MKNTNLRLTPVLVRATGRYRAVVHTGHEYDQFGNITRHGIVLRETPFGRNTITLTGFNKILTGSATSMVMVAGAGNTTPAETDSALASYLGKTDSVASQVTTRNTTPDVNGEVYWRTTYRYTFNPGSMGGGAVNVAEAGVTFGVSVGSVNASTPVGARGLLVDGGSPTTVSVDNAVEYLDIIWEYTEWIPASTTGVVSLTIDDVPTDFDYEVRPYEFDNTGGSFDYTGWQNAGSRSIPGFGLNTSKSGYPRAHATCAFEESITAITGDNLPSSATNDIPIGATDAYVSDSKQRTFQLTWLPVNANFTTGIHTIRVNNSHSDWQIGFDPAIAKVVTKQLDLYLTFAMANR